MNISILKTADKKKLLNNNPWFIVEKGFYQPREREIETILALGNGFIGTRNSLEELYEISDPGSFVAGIYEKDVYYSYNSLVKLPDWTRIQVFIKDNIVDLLENKILEQKRYLDLKKGIYIREWKTQDSTGRITSVKIIKFISLNNKHEIFKSLIIKPENYSEKLRVISAIDGNITNFFDPDFKFVQSDKIITASVKTNTDKLVAITQKSCFLRQGEFLLPDKNASLFYLIGSQSKIIYEKWEWKAEIDKFYTINSLLSVYSSFETPDPVEAIRKHLIKLEGNFYRDSLKSHIKKFKKRWNDTKIIISGDNKAQKWINFAIFRLITAGEFSGNNCSIPARDLTGIAYKGHVFWDTEIYLLPFFIFTMPEVARALLMYRYNTLSGARKNAKKDGFKGASYAWESTDTGIEMTPSQVILPNGETIKIFSGRYENHISPDIAYAVWQYWQVAQDEDFFVNYGAEIIFETARYCESLISKGNDDLYHIYNVVGPDEYHEIINDNAYTNFMVKFNLDIAGKTLNFLQEKHKNQYENLKIKINLLDQEIENWNKIKNSIYVSYIPETKIFEQFKGYFELDFIDINDYEPRTAPLDIILGREKIQKSQVIKQADVVMFLFLLANKFSEEEIETNYDYYEPRTGHGSSLSPGIHSIVAARLGKTDHAYKYFKQNSQIDLNNNMGNAAGGIHIASLGSMWMSIVMGFAGMYVYDEGLLFDPHMPDSWNKLEFSIFWHSQRVNIEINKQEITFQITGNQDVPISIGFENWKNLKPAKNKYSAYKKREKWYWKNTKKI
ncbi:MAG: glycosyl hydrolase family 65 protein [bacterium]